MKKHISLFFIIILILLFIFVGCKSLDSEGETIDSIEEEKLEENNNSSEWLDLEVLNIMTIDELKSVLFELDTTRRELILWIGKECHEEYDESLPPIPSEENDYNFRAVTKYKTLEELYDALREIYSKELADEEYNNLCVELQGFRENDTKTDWYDFTYYHFKEIDGRLYVRDDGKIDNGYSVGLPYSLDSLEIISETKNHIIIGIPLPESKFRSVLEIKKEADRWVIASDWKIEI